MRRTPIVPPARLLEAKARPDDGAARELVPLFEAAAAASASDRPIGAQAIARIEARLRDEAPASTPRRPRWIPAGAALLSTVVVGAAFVAHGLGYGPFAAGKDAVVTSAPPPRGHAGARPAGAAARAPRPAIVGQTSAPPATLRLPAREPVADDRVGGRAPAQASSAARRRTATAAPAAALARAVAPPRPSEEPGPRVAGPDPGTPRDQSSAPSFAPASRPTSAAAPRGGLPPPPPNVVGPEIDLFSRAVTALRRDGDARAALTAAEEYLRRHPRGLFGDEALRLRAEALLRAGRRTEALVALDALALGDSRTDVALRLARVDLRGAGGCRAALRELDRLVAVPHRELADRALVARALCRLRVGDRAGGEADLRAYLSRSPNGPDAEAARKRLGL